MKKGLERPVGVLLPIPDETPISGGNVRARLFQCVRTIEVRDDFLTAHHVYTTGHVKLEISTHMNLQERHPSVVRLFQYLQYTTIRVESQ